MLQFSMTGWAVYKSGHHRGGGRAYQIRPAVRAGSASRLFLGRLQPEHTDAPLIHVLSYFIDKSSGINDLDAVVVLEVS
jgi:hypothetical protein